MTTEQKPQTNLLAEGMWPCTVLSGVAGEDSDKPGVLKTRITVRLEDGPSKGRTTTYEDEINAKSSLYVQRSMRAVGWKTTKLASFASDVEDWIKNTGGKSTAEIKHIPTKKGTIWDKCNSIGRGPKALKEPSGSALADAEEALRNAMRDDGVSFGGGTDMGPSDVPPADSDDIPFATSSMSAERQIAKVLR